MMKVKGDRQMKVKMKGEKRSVRHKDRVEDGDELGKAEFV